MGLPNAFALLQQSGKRKPTEPSPRDGASANKKQKFSAVDKNLSESSFEDCNAFAHMMQKQRERSQTWSFFLGRHPDGAYYWHIWRDKHLAADAKATGGEKADAGLDHATQQRLIASAKWSATVQVPLAALECRCEGSTATAADTKVTMKLLTDIQPGPEDSLRALGNEGSAQSPSGRAWEYTGTSGLLKSALQKNVRLGRADAAVRVALHLLKLDASELLRRACIICLEDALLHPSLPLLVWLMAAVPKGYAMGRMLALACLTIIHELASVPVRDHQSPGPAAGTSSSPGVQLAAAASNLVRCILLRAAYGGMGGDVSMLQKFAGSWKYRFESSETLAILKAASTCQQSLQLDAQPDAAWLAYLHQRLSTTAGNGLQQLRGMEPGDIPLSAVDFHISNILENLLNNRDIITAALAAGRDPLQIMRDAIWLFSSSINARTWVQEPDQESQEQRRVRRSRLEAVWKVAAPPAKAYARQYVKARFREL
ncbi:hypothetical protein WJX75_005443 [Coccomyxa subellipsoidea]|uniref:Uncharacterized protein n=1 Tax=Coccomyxa subellipsoidea TaxID=248742 RepID=A0ABR2YUV3_9CHLO